VLAPTSTCWRGGMQVVCTTCSGAGSLPLKTFRFRQVLIDEAAQACETSCLVPLSRGALKVCLIGDHQQLPPLVKASDAAQLKTSLFERSVAFSARLTASFSSTSWVILRLRRCDLLWTPQTCRVVSIIFYLQPITSRCVRYVR